MNKNALIVGINQYKDKKLPDLTAPAVDVEAIAKTLEEFGEFEVTRLPEAIKTTETNTKKPYIDETKPLTFNQLEDALVKLFKPEGKQYPDTALFYFSGHGIRKNKGIKEGFLCTSDTDISRGFYGLSLQWLRRLLEESPIRQQIIWLDCCHSGELMNFDEANPGEKGQARDRCFIAASREFEASYEDLNSEYSVLTKIILEGLNPNTSNQQWINNYTLIEYINQNLRNEIQRPIFTNFGLPINLTRTFEAKTLVSKGEKNKDICPYKGLEYFDDNNEDYKYFYGRKTLTDRLLDRVRENNFLAIVGASGSGKSSVLRAGLLHQLKLGQKLADSQNWEIKIMLPGENPLKNLALSWLDSNLSDLERKKELDFNKSLLKKGAEGLQTMVEASHANRVVLVIDQFEEVFTPRVNLEERETFFQYLLESLTKNEKKLCLILAMRIDFFGKCFEREYNGLGNLIQDKDNFIAIPPMKEAELREPIIKPAEKVNLNLESGLAEQILKDIKNSSGSLPLLQDTLNELWKKRENNQLTLSAYSQLGGIGGTLNQRATDVYENLDSLEKDTAKHIFLALTTLGEGTEDTRRRIFKKDLVTAKHDIEIINKVIQKLTDEKLIVTRSRVEANSEIGREVEVEVIHEVLIREWKLLRKWLNESRDIIRQGRKIENAAHEWDLSGKKTDDLLSKKRLKKAKEFHQEQKEVYPLNDLAAKFINKSINSQRKERLKSFALFLIVPLIGTTIGGFLLFREIQLGFHNELIINCEGKESCPGRIDALKELVKAKKSLKSYNLKGANLEDANLNGAKLNGANLEDANLNGAYLNGAYLNGANLNGANLNDGVNLKDANLYGANLNGAKLNGAYLKGANLYRAKLYHAKLNGANLQDANLYGANLYGANLEHAKLNDANLEGANLEGVNLEGAELYRAKLYGAELYRAKLNDAKLNGAYLYGVNLEDAKLYRANLYGANLEDANLEGAYLCGVNLKGANLEGANLEGAYLKGAYLKGAYLKDAYLKGAYLKGANLTNTENLTNEQIKSALNWEEAYFAKYWDEEKRKWIVDEEKQKAKIREIQNTP